MKPVKILLVGLLGATAAACSGKASPEVDITCSGGTFSTFVNNLAMVQKTVSASDAAAGGAVPANGITATVISPVASVQICPDDCLDGSGSFKQEQEVDTDDFGVFQYTIGIDPLVPFEGDIIEIFNAISAPCTTTVTIQ